MAVYFYSRHPRWQKLIQEKRRALEAEIDELPISSRYWRMKERESLLHQARTQDKPDLGTARGLLTDAAREMGIGSINLTLVNQVLQLSGGHWCGWCHPCVAAWSNS